MQTCPNTNADGSRVAGVPHMALGGWRGRTGYAGILKILANTRFRLDARISSEKHWVGFWLCKADVKRVVPLMCTVCGETPEKITLPNLVSSTKSSARCACTWRPKHGTLAGRACVDQAIKERGYELALPEAEWEKAHLHRNENWRFLALKCVACKAPRHVVVARGASSYTTVGRCGCQTTGKGRASAGVKKRRQLSAAKVVVAAALRN